jgi:hypothetical protein
MHHRPFFYKKNNCYLKFDWYTFRIDREIVQAVWQGSNNTLTLGRRKFCSWCAKEHLLELQKCTTNCDVFGMIVCGMLLGNLSDSTPFYPLFPVLTVNLNFCL